MAIREKDVTSPTEHITMEAGTYNEDFYKSLSPPSDGGPVFVVHKEPPPQRG